MDEQTKDQIKQMIKQELLILFGSDKLIFQKDIQIWDGKKVQLGKTTGTQFGTEASQKFSVLGATPVIQQTPTSQTPSTITPNTSGIVDDSATWDSYTIGDIVKILKVFGFIS